MAQFSDWCTDICWVRFVIMQVVLTDRLLYRLMIFRQLITKILMYIESQAAEIHERWTWEVGWSSVRSNNSPERTNIPGLKNWGKAFSELKKWGRVGVTWRSTKGYENRCKDRMEGHYINRFMAPLARQLLNPVMNLPNISIIYSYMLGVSWQDKGGIWQRQQTTGQMLSWRGTS